MIVDDFKIWLKNQSGDLIIIDRFENNPSSSVQNGYGSNIILFEDKNKLCKGSISVRNNGFVDAEICFPKNKNLFWDIHYMSDKSVEFASLFKNMYDNMSKPLDVKNNWVPVNEFILWVEQNNCVLQSYNLHIIDRTEKDGIHSVNAIFEDLGKKYIGKIIIKSSGYIYADIVLKSNDLLVFCLRHNTNMVVDFTALFKNMFNYFE